MAHSLEVTSQKSAQKIDLLQFTRWPLKKNCF